MSSPVQLRKMGLGLAGVICLLLVVMGGFLLLGAGIFSGLVNGVRGTEEARYATDLFPRSVIAPALGLVAVWLLMAAYRAGWVVGLIAAAGLIWAAWLPSDGVTTTATLKVGFTVPAGLIVLAAMMPRENL